MTMPRTGGCLCGAVRFAATPRLDDHELHIDACHCTMCRRQVGGPLLAVTCDHIDVSKGDTLAAYQSSDWAERCFCSRCGSNLFWRMRDGSFFSVHAGAFDDLTGARLTAEIYIDQKPSFYDFSQPTQKLTAAEVRALFGFS